MDYLEFTTLKNAKKLRPVGRSYLDRTLLNIARMWDKAIFSSRSRYQNKIISTELQIILTLIFLLFVSLTTSLTVLTIYGQIEFLLILSLVFKKVFTLKDFLTSGFLVTLLFTLILCLPITVNIFSHLECPVIWKWWTFSTTRSWGFIKIPPTIGVTKQGILSAIILLLRVMISVSAVLTLTLSKSWLDLFYALKKLRVPPIILQITAMSLIYLHWLLKRTEDVHLARKARMIGRQRILEGYKWSGVRMAQAWEDSWRLMEEVESAMLARGFGRDWVQTDSAKKSKLKK